MPVKKRIAKTRIGDLSELAYSILTDTLVEPPNVETDPAAAWEHYALVWDSPGLGPSLGDLWRLHGEAVLADWIVAHPGTRPTCWWLFDAPNRSNERQFYACFRAPPPLAQRRLLTEWRLLTARELASLPVRSGGRPRDDAFSPLPRVRAPRSGA